ncbi:MAG: hypothetical protein J2P52_10870 [Blastocatellia bacterium]|nr:hypothetical protein [Blastocatellia bacterium]
MRIDQFILKPFKSAMIFAAIVLLSVSLSPATGAGNNAQDLNFRLMNIERRLDQLQIRVDTVERAFQAQSLNNTGSSNASTQTLLELQQQQLVMAQQLVAMQKQMLELRKDIDQQAAREADQGKDAEKKDAEKKDGSKQEVKPKVQPKKP